MRSAAWVIGILSIVILAYEIALMHILSIIQWYHFAYMIISVALLGFGASGTVLSIFHRGLLERFEWTFALSALLCTVSILLTFAFSQRIPFDAYLILWNPTQVWYLLAFYLLMFIPFFFGATCIGLAFIRYTENIGALYFANLLGSAFGGLVALGLMYLLFPQQLPVAIACIGFVATVLAFIQVRPRWIISLLFIIGIAPLVYWGCVHPASLKMSQYKSLSKSLHLPEAKIISEKTSPLGLLQVVSSPVLRYAPGLSLAYTGYVPTQFGVFNDGEWAGAMIATEDSGITGWRDYKAFLDYTTSALPYHIKQKPSAPGLDLVLIIGAGTGTEVFSALRHGAEYVTGIELNPQVIELVKRDFREQTDRLYERKNVNIIVAEGRGFLARQMEQYDLIVIPLMESFAASAAGMYSLNENYLFTVESFSLILQHLRPGGILAVTEWLKFPERNTIKLIATMIEAMERCGYEHPERHLAAIRGWATATVLVKQTPFTSEETSLITRFCEERSFDPIYFPGMGIDQANRFNQLNEPIHYTATLSLFSYQRNNFYSQYRFFIEPATDNKPYFSHFFKWKSLPYLIETFGKQGVPFLEWGYLILTVTLLQIVVVSAILILVPLFFLRNRKLEIRGGWRVLLYFGGLGIGYMFIEIVLIQKFILFLAHPIYSVSAVITGMLLFSGLGSLWSKRLSQITPRAIRVTVAGIVMFTLLYLVGLNQLFGIFLKAPDAVRFGIALALLAPISFCMGIPFPLGLRQLSTAASPLVPWAWGINGCASVVSTVLATLLAIEFGFSVVFLCAGGCYVVAGLVGQRMVIAV